MRVGSVRASHEDSAPSHIVDHNYITNHHHHPHNAALAEPSRPHFQPFNHIDNHGQPRVIAMNSMHQNRPDPNRVDHYLPTNQVAGHFEPFNHRLGNHMVVGPTRVGVNVLNNHVMAGQARGINQFEPFNNQLDSQQMGGNYGLGGAAGVRQHPGFAGDAQRNTNNPEDLMFIDRRLSMMDVSNDLPPI